jgi:hypothetical protein
MSTVLEISEIIVFRLFEGKQFHSIETADGKLMLCADSIYTKS